MIRNLTNGRILPLDVRFWYHLFNVTTTSSRRRSACGTQRTSARRRRLSTTTASPTTPPKATSDTGRPSRTSGDRSGPWRSARRRSVPRPGEACRAAEPRPQDRKALLIGINDYPDPAQRLEGCVNDVFTMSAVLQECGFPPETIRTCLDDRATADGILSRMKWLLDDPKPGDELVFYYSGHGARIPEYGEDFEPDHHVESLVPWDFDWTPEKAISDDQIFGLYSQLPYDWRLMMIFDCCHSGGIHRDGGLRPRGITPPDDIRHRELKWDSKTKMWVSRDFARINDKFTPEKDLAADYFGGRAPPNAWAGQRCCAASLLAICAPQARRRGQARGPYLPLIIEACGEDEFSYEYRHGAASHGAFTYSLPPS